MMDSYQEVIDEELIQANERGNRNKVITERGNPKTVETLVANMDDLLEDTTRRDSAPYNPHSRVGYGTVMKMNQDGQTPMLDTAETLKHTDDQTNTVEYEGATTQLIESVRDFPHESANGLCGSDHNQAILNNDPHQSIFNTQPNTHHKTQTNSSIDHLQSAVNEKRNHMESISSTNAKDFITENLKSIKTIKEIKAEKSSLRKMREQEILARKNSNPYGYKFFGLQESRNESTSQFQQVYRSQEWSKLAMINNQLTKKPMPHAGRKNTVTNHAFEEAPEVTPVDLSLIAFVKSRKEKAFQTRNQSSINMLKSYRTLDFENKDEEDDLIGCELANVSLAQTLNRKSQLDWTTYGREKTIPEEYQTYQSKQEIIHNKNNADVQEGRMRNYQSSVI